MLALTNVGDWVLDPFCGVGSSLIAGLMHRRRVIGVDKEPVYTGIARQRIDKFYKGQLKVREMGKQVMTPNKREKLARAPDEWLNNPVTNKRTLYNGTQLVDSTVQLDYDHDRGNDG